MFLFRIIALPRRSRNDETMNFPQLLMVRLVEIHYLSLSSGIFIKTHIYNLKHLALYLRLEINESLVEIALSEGMLKQLLDDREDLPFSTTPRPSKNSQDDVLKGELSQIYLNYYYETVLDIFY